MNEFHKALLNSILSKVRSGEITSDRARELMFIAGIYRPKVLKLKRCSADTLNKVGTVIITGGESHD